MYDPPQFDIQWEPSSSTRTLLCAHVHGGQQCVGASLCQCLLHSCLHHYLSTVLLCQHCHQSMQDAMVCCLQHRDTHIMTSNANGDFCGLELYWCVHEGMQDEVESSQSCLLTELIWDYAPSVAGQHCMENDVGFVLYTVQNPSIFILWTYCNPILSATHSWWPFSAARCIGVFLSTFLMSFSTWSSIKTVMADMSLSLAVTCNTLFSWLSVDLINLGPHVESATRNYWQIKTYE